MTHRSRVGVEMPSNVWWMGVLRCVVREAGQYGVENLRGGADDITQGRALTTEGAAGFESGEHEHDEIERRARGERNRLIAGERDVLLVDLGRRGGVSDARLEHARRERAMKSIPDIHPLWRHGHHRPIFPRREPVRAQPSSKHLSATPDRPRSAAYALCGMRASAV